MLVLPPKPRKLSGDKAMTYLLPTSLEAALECLDATPSAESLDTEARIGSPATIIAGATDYYPSLGSPSIRTLSPGTSAPGDGESAGAILDITRISELGSIERDGDHWRIGALVTWSDLASATLPPAFAGLQQAATQIGSVQIQNVGTLAGNVCNASPAADGVPPLLSLGAKVELRSVSETRQVPLEEFILGNRSTERRPDELVTAVLAPHPCSGTIGSFEKLGARAYLAISIVMVAAVAEIDKEGTIRSARVALGACSEVAQRLPELEADLVGVSIDNLGEGDLIEPRHLTPLSPIDDVRASAAYRMSVTPRLIARALSGCQQVGA